ncbi:MAG: hypothetical protein ACRC9L_06460 [Brevinema sp.]
MISHIKKYIEAHPYQTLFISTFILFFLSMAHGIGITFVGDYAVYTGMSQNLFHGGTLYQTAIDTKNTGFFFIYYYLIYLPYASFFATTEFLHVWHAVVTLFWYFGLSALIYNILKPFYHERLCLFSALAFHLFNLGNRHSLFFNQPQATLMIMLILSLFIVHTYASQKFWHHTIYGVLIAFCFLLSTPYIILALLVPIFAFYRYKQEKRWDRFILRGVFAFLGFILGLVPFFVYYISRNALEDWWFFNFYYPQHIYLSHAYLFVLSGFQITPFLALPFLSKTKNVVRKAILIYLSCFIVPVVLFLMVLPSLSSFDYEGFEKAKLSSNLLLRLFLTPVDIPLPSFIAKPATVLLSFFTGVNYLVLHTPTSIYHHYLVAVIFCASIFALVRKNYPPFPLFVLGITTLAARFLLSKGSGGDSYNMYALWILWLPFIISVSSANFAKIQKVIFFMSYGVAVVYLFILNIFPIERVNSYSQQVRAIVRANPDKTPSVLVFPWGYSYSTKWKLTYYNQHENYRSTYEEVIAAQNPEALLMINSPDFITNQARYAPVLTNYQKVTDDLYTLYLRKDTITSWKLP